LLRRSLRLRLSSTALIMLQAKCRMVAMLAGPCLMRDRALSPLKVTSSTQCRLWRVDRRDCASSLSQNGALHPRPLVAKHIRTGGGCADWGLGDYRSCGLMRLGLTIKSARR
jgi:hypothetical protein